MKNLINRISGDTTREERKNLQKLVSSGKVQMAFDGVSYSVLRGDAKEKIILIGKKAVTVTV